MSTRFKNIAAADRDGEAMVRKTARADAAGYPTPGEVFGEIGVTLAAFLAIALLANLLAAALGA